MRRICGVPPASIARAGRGYANPFPDTSVSANLPLVATYQMDQWSALGDPTRREIFERLAARPQAVGDLAREMPVSRPAVSQHLKVLKLAGLVTDQPVGNIHRG